MDTRRLVARSFLPLGRVLALGLCGAAAFGCTGHRGDSADAPPASTTPPATRPVAAAIVPVVPVSKPFAPSHVGCDEVPVFATGVADGSICADDAVANGLTTVDLSDVWTPRVFAVDPATRSAPEYRATYLQLASQPAGDLAFYGIAPTLSVVATRLTDDRRRTCDAAIDLAPVRDLYTARKAAPDARAAAAMTRGPAARPAVSAIQSELVCAGLLRTGAATGSMGGSTEAALEAFRRRHMIVGAGLDDDTLAALALGGEELELRAFLRVLRERVADAAGLVEDGSASSERAFVVERAIDLSPFAPTSMPLDDGAPDLVGAATDRAARELGWTSADGARAFLAARGKAGLHDLRVAVKLPAAPSYASKAMDLRVEIDRGDVFYDMPGQAAAERRRLGEVRRPSFVLYAKDGDHDRALVRWSSTIGGWKKERTEDGELALKYKESDVGERVWRQIIAAPAWLPPDSTPETDLVSELKDGSFALKRTLIQPGYANAYGLVMMIHHEPVAKGSEIRFLDHGIRTHGSVDYKSIQRGESHGCHRLYNQLALRLSGFLLEHRNHVRRGKMNAGYHRTLALGEQTIEVDVPNRGYLYELEPPVPVRVLRGRVSGEHQKPMSAVPLAPDAGAKG